MRFKYLWSQGHPVDNDKENNNPDKDDTTKQLIKRLKDDGIYSKIISYDDAYYVILDQWVYFSAKDVKAAKKFAENFNDNPDEVFVVLDSKGKAVFTEEDM